MDMRDALDLRPDTEHGLLVAYGEFARQHGLLDRLMAMPVPVKTRVYKPQAKTLELFVGILSGIEYLQDLDLGPRPLTKDLAVAQAWGQPGFAHYSGVSRTLDAADQQTIAAVGEALRAFGEPFIDQAIDDELRHGSPLVFDADLTGQAVSSTSQTYPGAAFGWMDDGVRLGYQLARISVETQRNGRLWLKESKGVFKVQHLMSRSPAGIALQVSFTTFASNFVRFAAEWLRSRVESPRRRFWEMLVSVKGLTRIAANSPAYLEGNPESLSLQFTHRSSLPEVVIHLGGSSARQLALEVGRPIRIASP